MRFITFDKNGVETVGVRLGSDLVDLSLADARLPRTLVGLIQNDLLKRAGEVAQKAPASAHRSLEGLKYLPVIPHPPKFFGIGTNYPSHAGPVQAARGEKVGKADNPRYFAIGSEPFAAHNEPLQVPRAMPTFDYEVELVFVFGKRAKHVKEKDFLPYVAGYTVFNDGSIRGWQAIDLVLGKGSDKTKPMGPEFVTADELPPGGDGLNIMLRRNGKLTQNDNTKSMYRKVPEIVELLTSFITFNPGDCVTTGTTAGTIADTHPKYDPKDTTLPWLKAGEVIETEIEGIGMLRNPIIDEPV